ncbi:MAG: hypothetical protein A2X64_02320 [Ignavibacteria bacterium GWF2_33_9]|nr:MAG: hypothetical protein A2X64_02320 [Ignavibacteria bacterium GWF2_33_9]
MFKDNIQNIKNKNNIINVLKAINYKATIAKNELDKFNLQNRIDTKYIIHISALDRLIINLNPEFRILEINNIRLFTYETQYFDTEDLQFYNQHHNKRANRQKVRLRNYLDSSIAFLEIKSKNNKKKTSKTRIQIEPKNLSNFNKNELDLTKEITFLNDNLDINYRDLHNSVTVKYQRITLVNINTKEKITFDFNFSTTKNPDLILSDLVIIEHKCSDNSRINSFFLYFKAFGAHKFKLSKYCFGLFLSGKEIKINNFKHRYLQILKLIHERGYNGFNCNNGEQLKLNVSRFFD